MERGQLFISIPEIIEVCSYKVGYRTEKPTKKQIFGILEWLRNPNEGVYEGNNESHMIETTKVTHGMLVKVCNYSFYQDPKNYEGNDEKETKEPTKRQRKEQQGNNINKNDKNDNNDNNDKSASRSKLKFETQHLKLAEILYKKIKENNPHAKKPNLESWANTFRLMIDRDEREGKDIQDLILWSQSHHFWYKNILSADKLRKQFDRLHLEMKDEKDKPLKVINGGRYEMPVDEQFENLF
ncbi:MAG TPA: hypothetical protein VLA13_07980 [Massilibacterium sp.]|nr:hypothetical protein [Massilibacterium sp.]